MNYMYEFFSYNCQFENITVTAASQLSLVDVVDVVLWCGWPFRLEKQLLDEKCICF